MSKLFHLKEWLTVDAAAKHLSVAIDEELCAADLLRLALDGNLTLSVRLVNGAYGREWSPVKAEDVNWKQVPDLEGKGVLNLPENGPLWTDESGGLRQLQKPIVPLAPGVWDLPLMEAERLSVESEFERLSGGPECTRVSLEGPVVRSGDRYFQLQDHFSNNSYFDKGRLRKPYNHPDNFFPASGLPDDGVLVLRRNSLADFLASLRINEDLQTTVARPLDPRQHTTYLNIIGGLLKLMLGRTPTGRPQSVFESQTAIIEALLANCENKPGISETTLQGKFAEANRTLSAT